MCSRPRRPVTIGIVLLLTLAPAALQAQVPPSITLVFERILILPPAGEAEVGAQAEALRRLLWREWAGLHRFDVISPPPVGSPPDSADAARQRALELGADGVLTSRITPAPDGVTITLALYPADSPAVFALERFTVDQKDLNNPNRLSARATIAARKLIARIPFQALVRSVDGERVRISAGTIHGIDAGMAIQISRLAAIQRNELTGEVTKIERRRIATLRAVRVGETGTLALVEKTEPDVQVRPGDWVTFRPDAKLRLSTAARRQELLTQKERLQDTYELRVRQQAKAAPTPAAPKPRETVPAPLRPPAKVKPVITPPVAVLPPTAPRLRFDATAALGRNRFSLEAPDLKIHRSANRFLLAELHADWSVWHAWGVALEYRTGWVRFDSQDASKIRVDVSMTWFTPMVRYQRVFSARGNRWSRIWVGAGYLWYLNRPHPEDTLAFVQVRHQGPVVTTGIETPLVGATGLAIAGQYAPRLAVHEQPVESGGNGRAQALNLTADLFYQPTDHLRLTAGYGLYDLRARFSGDGDRGGGVTDARTRDMTQAIRVGLTFSF